MERIFFGSLRITTIKRENRIQMDLEGECHSRRSAEILTPLFNDLIADNYRDIIVSFDKLDFMSSAMIPPIIRFISKLEDHEQNCVITYASDSKWQAASFGPLKKFVKANGIRNTVVIQSRRE